jgi:hypothetical protein
MRLIAANALSTADVRSPAGENVGTVVDFMLDTKRGCVAYAVLAVGGVLGVGAKMLAIPPELLSFGTNRLTLGVDTAKLEQAPGFDRANPPTYPDGALSAGGRPQPANQQAPTPTT